MPRLRPVVALHPPSSGVENDASSIHDDSDLVSSAGRAEARWSETDVESRWYEHRKRDIMLATLPARHYARALEVGRSSRALAARLAERCDDLLSVELHDVGSDLPAGAFDLVVLAEVGCSLSFAQLDVLLSKTEAAIGDRGTLLACHWRRPVPENTLTGDDVHAVLEARGLPRIARHEEADFIIDVYSRDACSVAQHDGIT